MEALVAEHPDSAARARIGINADLRTHLLRFCEAPDAQKRREENAKRPDLRQTGQELDV